MHFQIEKYGSKWRWWLIAANGRDLGRSIRDYGSRYAALRAVYSIQSCMVGGAAIYDAEGGFWV